MALANPAAPTLYQLEQDLVALLDTEAFVSKELETEFENDLAATLQASVDKRDRVGQFLRHCEMQQDNCDAEIKRLEERKRSFATAEKRMRSYVQRVIESLGMDESGKHRKLDGNTVTFSLRAKPASVEIDDPAKVPAEYKSATVTLPLPAWDAVAEACRDLLPEEPNVVETVSKTAVKAALDRGKEVPGADLSIGEFILHLR